jgi:acyl-CoA thioester hydrolase
MIALPEIPRIQTTTLVHFFDTDAGGVVHNIAYLRFIEVARCELAKVLGYTLIAMRPVEGGACIVPVVVRTEIDYLKPARLGDQLNITAELLSIERVRFSVGFEIHSEAGVILTRCKQILAPVEIPSGKPKPVPVEWRDAYSWLSRSLNSQGNDQGQAKAVVC